MRDSSLKQYTTDKRQEISTNPRTTSDYLANNCHILLVPQMFLTRLLDFLFVFVHVRVFFLAWYGQISPYWLENISHPWGIICLEDEKLTKKQNNNDFDNNHGDRTTRKHRHKFGSPKKDHRSGWTIYETKLPCTQLVIINNQVWFGNFQSVFRLTKYNSFENCECWPWVSCCRTKLSDTI